MIHYLDDFAEAFMLLFGTYVDVLSAGVIVLGMVLVTVWGTIPHLAKRV